MEGSILHNLFLGTLTSLFLRKQSSIEKKIKNKTAQIETRQITTSELLAEGEERLSTKQFSKKRFIELIQLVLLWQEKIQVLVTTPILWEKE